MHTKKTDGMLYMFVGGRQVHLQISDLCNLVYTLSLHVSQCSTVVRTQNLIVILVLHVYRNSFSFLVTHLLFYTCV